MESWVQLVKIQQKPTQISGEILYHILKKQEIIFTLSSLMMTLADGTKIKIEIQITIVKICPGGLTWPLNLVAIPEAKGITSLWE